MQWLLGARIALTPRPLKRRVAALEVGLLGHCPGRVRVERLTEAAREAMRAIGYGEAVDALNEGSDLSHLPIPLHASAEFHDIFPDAASAATTYKSQLAGASAWSAQAVDDFFANGGEKLWLVRVPERDGQAGFLPGADTQLHDVRTLRGLACLLLIPTLAVVMAPDLERLQIPARLPDIPRNRLDNPYPQFLPCASDVDDGHRERRYPSELINSPEPWPMETLLRGILLWLSRYRPDVQWLMSLPLDFSTALDSPVVAPAALRSLLAIRDGGSGHQLRHIQFLFPYLRSPRQALMSPAALIAGAQAAIARRAGPWHSMAAHALRSDAMPYPRLTLAQTLALRDEPGIGVLKWLNGALRLDDERLVVPALPPEDYAGSADRERFKGFRAAEVMRFLGFLRRQLQALGEQLIFSVDERDPRPRLALEDFFRRLHTLGALRGARPELAYSITQSSPQPGAIQFNIQIAPAFPIDRLWLTFAHWDGQWRTELAHG